MSESRTTFRPDPLWLIDALADDLKQIMLNHIVMMGRLTKDPELRQAGDTPVCTFRIACDRDYKNKAGEKETDFE